MIGKNPICVHCGCTKDSKDHYDATIAQRGYFSHI
jgi:hypothetical protein